MSNWLWLTEWYGGVCFESGRLQQRYLQEHGVFADRAALVRWLQAPAQKLQQLDTNECIHSHACGEYVLDELQRGAMATDVVDGLLRKYLVETTVQRVAAYRKYREQSGAYWTVKGLERVHWRPLYDQVQVDIKLTEYKHYRTKVFRRTALSGPYHRNASMRGAADTPHLHYHT